MSVITAAAYLAQITANLADNTNELIKPLTLRVNHTDLKDSVVWLLDAQTISGAKTFSAGVTMTGGMTVGGVTIDASNLITRRIASPTDGHIPFWDNTNTRLNFDSFNNLLDNISIVGGAKTFSGNVTISGNLTVSGSTTQVNSEITTSDAVIDMNNGEVGAGVTLGYSGLNIERGSADNFWFGFDEVRNAFSMGTITALSAPQIATTQLVATRIDSPTDGYIPYWENAQSRLNFDSFSNLLTASDITGMSNITFHADKTLHLPTNPTSNAAGAMKFTGGNLSVYDSGWQVVGTVNASSSVLVSGTPTSGQIAEWTGANTIQGVDDITLSKATGLDAATPVVFKMNSESNGNWTANAEPSRIDFTTDDVGGTGAGSVRAAIRHYVAFDDAHGLKFYTNDGTSLGLAMALQSDKDVACYKDLIVVGQISTDDTTDANTSAGSIQTDGGISVTKKAVIGGDIICESTTDSSSTTTGSIQTDGGLGVVKKSYFGDDVDIQGSLSINKEGTQTSSLFDVLSIGGGEALGRSDTDAMYLTSGAYYDGDWRYRTTGNQPVRLRLNADGTLNVESSSVTGNVGNTLTWTSRIAMDSSGNVDIASLGTGTVYSNSGTLTNTDPSDKRLKENFKDLQYGLKEIIQLKHHWYNYKGENRDLLGWIAQEVQPIMPEMVTTFKKEFDGKETEFLGLNTPAMNVVTQRALQEFYHEYQKEIKALKSELRTLKNK